MAEDEELCTACLSAQNKSPEFLQVKLGKTLAEQFPECKHYDGVKDAKSRRDGPSFRCYLGSKIFDHDFPVFPGTEPDEESIDLELKMALADTETDNDTGQVGYVGTSYDMDIFKETFSSLKAKRGQPSSCTRSVAQNLMGARLNQLHCTWKQPWGLIAVTAPSDDDLTLFDVWALTSHHMQLRRREEVAGGVVPQRGATRQSLSDQHTHRG
jgi:hypothetical protein